MVVFFIAKQKMYVKSGSVANLSCPYETQDVSVKWRGPQNLTIYSINNEVNVQLDISSRLKVNVESTTGTYNLLVLNFTSEDTGLYRCDTILNKHSVQHETFVNVAGNIMNHIIVTQVFYRLEHKFSLLNKHKLQL